jgi:glycosyltransferase involved in cell wall biosynthesis
MRLGLVLPFWNEAAVAAPTLARVVAVGRRARLGLGIFAVDHGSTDGTGDVLRAAAARAPEVRVVSLADNRGYGGGIQAGLAAAVADGAPVVGWAWGDAQVDPGLLPGLLRAVEAGASLAMARRMARHDGLFRAVQGAAWARACAARGVPVADPHGCPKLLPAALWAALGVDAADWSLDLAVVREVAARGGRIVSLPAAMAPRAGGRSKVNLRAAWALGHALVRGGGPGR